MKTPIKLTVILNDIPRVDVYHSPAVRNLKLVLFQDQSICLKATCQ